MLLKVVLIVGKDARIIEAKALILRAVGCLVHSADFDYSSPVHVRNGRISISSF